jgi:hypothetical protein
MNIEEMLDWCFEYSFTNLYYLDYNRKKTTLKIPDIGLKHSVILTDNNKGNKRIFVSLENKLIFPFHEPSYLTTDN